MLDGSLKALIRTVAQPGEVVWIGVRSERRAPMVALPHAPIAEAGLDGDHARPGKRAVTLLQSEHLSAIGSFLGRAPIEPALLRRNLVISGINLLALKGRMVRLGTAWLEITGACAPCSRMEEALGPGGYSAMRGHGGVTARVIMPGEIKLGEIVQADDRDDA